MAKQALILFLLAFTASAQMPPRVMQDLLKVVTRSVAAPTTVPTILSATAFATSGQNFTNNYTCPAGANLAVLWQSAGSANSRITNILWDGAVFSESITNGNNYLSAHYLKSPAIGTKSLVCQKVATTAGDCVLVFIGYSNGTTPLGETNYVYNGWGTTINMTNTVGVGDMLMSFASRMTTSGFTLTPSLGATNVLSITNLVIMAMSSTNATTTTVRTLWTIDPIYAWYAGAIVVKKQ